MWRPLGKTILPFIFIEERKGLKKVLSSVFSLTCRVNLIGPLKGVQYYFLGRLLCSRPGSFFPFFFAHLAMRLPLIQTER